MSIIAWWSGGVTSAVACRLAIELYKDVRIIYIHIDSHHPDTLRFKEDCEKWYGQKIETWQNAKYKDQFEVAKKGYINGPTGAPCTKKLKKDVRSLIEKELQPGGQVWGFEFEKSQINRAIRFKQQYPNVVSYFPLIDSNLTKNECVGIIKGAGIEIPLMYKLGYSNNNCIGCVKGGAGYWNKIRKDFPEVFNRMASIEREVKATCLKNENGRVYLYELDPNAGTASDLVFGECGIFCQVDFAHLMDKKVDKILNGEMKL